MTFELLSAFGKSFLFVLAALLPILNPAATAPIKGDRTAQTRCDSGRIVGSGAGFCEIN